MKKHISSSIVYLSIICLLLSILGTTITSCSNDKKNELNNPQDQTLENPYNNFPAKGPYFIIDDRIIEDRWMIERFTVPLEKHVDNPLVVKDLPWEGTGPLMGGTVTFDPQDKLFKMWYLIWDAHSYYNKLPFSYNVCYAESNDGIHWDKPILELFDKRGTIDNKNNFIKLGLNKTQNIDVEFNPKAKSIDEKFIAIHNDSGGVFISKSADGKTFNYSHKNPAVSYHSDTQNNFVYDEVRDRWLMYVRPKAFAGDGLKHVNRRRVAVKESKDLISWTNERTVLVPEEGDATDFYGLTVFRRGDLFFGFLQIYDAGLSYKVSSELVWSPDGYQWNRLPKETQKTILPLGNENDWDYGQIYVSDKPVMVDDEMWFYYAGNNTTHNTPGEPAIGMAKTKKDRLFGARSKQDTIGRILTRPIKINGDLFLNAEIEGTIKVEVRSVIEDEALDGYTADDCMLINGDNLNIPVRWGNKSLSDLKGKKIRLRFELNDATLYSFNIY